MSELVGGGKGCVDCGETYGDHASDCSVTKKANARERLVDLAASKVRNYVGSLVGNEIILDGMYTAEELRVLSDAMMGVVDERSHPLGHPDGQ